MGSKSFLELKGWQLAHEVYLSVYRQTERYPRRDLFGISQQMVRAAYSVPSNIVEGFGRRSARDKAHFYTIAAGSAEELKYGLIASRDLGRPIDFDALWRKTDDVCKMLRSLIDAVLRGGSAVEHGAWSIASRKGAGASPSRLGTEHCGHDFRRGCREGEADPADALDVRSVLCRRD